MTTVLGGSVSRPSQAVDLKKGKHAVEGPECQASCCQHPRAGPPTRFSSLSCVIQKLAPNLRASGPQSRQLSELRPFRAKAQRMGRQPVTCQARLTWRGALAPFLRQLCVIAFVFFCLGGAPPPQ